MTTPITSIAFNQDGTMFGAATPTGFRMYDCGGGAFRVVCHRDFPDGGLQLIEPLYKTAIMALVGGEPVPKFPPNKVILWDDHEGRPVGEIATRGVVRAVRLRKDTVVVVHEHKVLVYGWERLDLRHQVETVANPSGLVALSTAADSTVLACPGLHRGQVRVELYESRRTKYISAHQSALQAIALSPDGRLLATSSDKGTLIRVFSTNEATKLRELRRGSEPTVMHSLAFSRDGGLLACTAGSGTLHCFAVAAAGEGGAGGGERGAGEAGTSREPDALGSGYNYSYDGEPGQGEPPEASTPSGGSRQPKNRTLLGSSALNLVKSVLPKVRPINFLTSEWSFAHYHLPPAEQGGGGRAPQRTAVTFGPSGDLLVASTSGFFYRFSLPDPAAVGSSSTQLEPMTTMFFAAM